MAIKLLVPMTTLPSDNEQTGVVPRTATGAGTTVSREFPELAAFSKAMFVLDITAVGGTNPTLDVTIQGWNPLSEKWHEVATFQQQNATSPASPIASGSQLVKTSTLDFETYRAQWTVGGTNTPTVTFTLGAIAHTEEPAVDAR